MSIDLKSKALVYKITYLIDNRYYIGISFGKNPSHLKRFNEHLNGKGSVFIKKLLNEGASKENFSIELIFQGTFEECRDKEIELAILWPVGLNGNKGTCILQTPEVRYKRSLKINPKKEEIYKKRNETLQNRTDDQVKKHKEKVSLSMKKYRANEDVRLKEKRKENRIKSNLENYENEVKRKRKISETKRLKGSGNNFTEESKARRKATMEQNTIKRHEEYKNKILTMTEEDYILFVENLSRYKKYVANNIRKLMNE